ncbi:LOW QUALITY PROTEIN: uncharacterized protein LOC108026603 [Drosophila biarmipes]|uniref:LOW QUALITY PROTEIN: uncharacterized protein LOC108026603 n=1 Tax=Drosophila biarmipes TaxID=125945 RepID=UPI0021CCA0B1|nr:LOW QUALITY PROTEIN: uncharacterized protein LOC108026603 [Drosophila biarmipes]
MLVDTDLASGVIRSPYSFDIPHAFIFNESEFVEPVYCGPYMEIVKHFAETYHYRLLLDPVESLPKKSVVEEDIGSGVYNISLHGVTIRPDKIGNLSEVTRHSYPLEMMTHCVMVPLAPELPKWMYMVWPLGRYIWTCVFLGTFYVALLLRYVHWREPGNATHSYSRNVLQAMALLMFSPNMNMTVKLKHASLRVIVFYTLLFVLGFILTNYHLSHMTAFDMKPVFLRPIDTWSDDPLKAAHRHPRLAAGGAALAAGGEHHLAGSPVRRAQLTGLPGPAGQSLAVLRLCGDPGRLGLLQPATARAHPAVLPPVQGVFRRPVQRPAYGHRCQLRGISGPLHPERLAGGTVELLGGDRLSIRQAGWLCESIPGHIPSGVPEPSVLQHGLDCIGRGNTH